VAASRCRVPWWANRAPSPRAGWVLALRLRAGAQGAPRSVPTVKRFSGWGRSGRAEPFTGAGKHKAAPALAHGAGEQARGEHAGEAGDRPNEPSVPAAPTPSRHLSSPRPSLASRYVCLGCSIYVFSEILHHLWGGRGEKELRRN